MPAPNAITSENLSRLVGTASCPRIVDLWGPPSPTIPGAMPDAVHRASCGWPVAAIVRGSDTDRFDVAPEADGLLAISLGLSRSHGDDHEQLEAGMAIYDTLHRWARDAHGERHDWSWYQPSRSRAPA